MRLIFTYVTLMGVLHRAVGSQMVFALSARDRESILHKTCLPRLATYPLHDPETKTAFEIQSGAPRCSPQLVVCHVNDTRAYDRIQQLIRKQDEEDCPKSNLGDIVNIIYLIALAALIILGIFLGLIVFVERVLLPRLRCCRCSIDRCCICHRYDEESLPPNADVIDSASACCC